MIIEEITKEVIYMNDKKKFIIPEALLVSFSNEDIITSSGDVWGDDGTDNGEGWGGHWGPEIPDGDGGLE